jgi:hypothetical protein
VDGDPVVFTKIDKLTPDLIEFFSKKDLHNLYQMIYRTNTFQKIISVGLFMNLSIGKVIEM